MSQSRTPSTSNNRGLGRVLLYYIAMGALTFVPFAPDGIFSRFTALPIQIFNWTSRPQADFQEAAAAGIIVLLIVLLSLNALAVILRTKLEKRQ